MIHLSADGGLAGGETIAAASRDALAETLSMLAQECAGLSTQACAHFSDAGRRATRHRDAVEAWRGLMLAERLERLQGWIDVHRRALDAAVAPEEFAARRGALAGAEDLEAAALAPGFSPAFEDVVISLQRFEARIRRLDELLHEQKTH